MSEILFSSFQLGPFGLKNRVVMAPMTRSRCIDNVPSDLVAEYYGQRSEAGLIITEGTSPSANGLGYARIPGLFTETQSAGWSKVAKAVHATGSRVFVQLMHTGRVSHPANMAPGAEIIAPSAVALAGTMYTDAAGMQPHPVPREMTESDIETAITEFVASAKLAISSGLDGVELHGANGYLIDQFLNTASNKRSDRWGGSVENRTRFALDLARRVGEAIGFNRLGMRISPYGVFGGMETDAETDAVYAHLASGLSRLGLVYLHVVDHSAMGAPEVPQKVKDLIRSQFRGTVVLSGGYDRKRAEHDLIEKRGELVAFGRPFIANPRLVTKLKSGEALLQPDQSTLYTPGEKGYTDYSL